MDPVDWRIATCHTMPQHFLTTKGTSQERDQKNCELVVVLLLVIRELQLTEKKKKKKAKTKNDNDAFCPTACLPLEIRLALNTVQPPFFIDGFFH